MRIVGFFAVFVLGASIGIGATWSWMVFGPSAYPSVSPGEVRAEDDHRDYSTASSMPTKQLASRLLARAGRSFVADTRYGNSPFDWVGFYAQPKPYGDTLCSVDFVTVPRKVVHGRVEKQNDFWEDDISVERMFFVWKLPGTDPKVTREDACAHDRDFRGRLIYARETLDVSALEREANILPVAVAKAKSGKVDFKLTCLDARDDNHPKACNGVELLAHVDLRNVSQVDQAETTKTEHSERHVDWVYMRHGWIAGCGKNEATRIEAISTQVYGRHANWEGDLQEINIVRSTFC